LNAPVIAATTAAEVFLTNRRGIRFMVIAMCCFIANDALVKLASESLPAGQLIFVRGAMATAWVLAVAGAPAPPLPVARLAHRWVAIRAGIDSVATVLLVIVLAHLPIANATAINMASPLFIVALAVPLLGERVDARRWAAIGLGFAGVLMVIQPRIDDFNGYALLCLFVTLLHALRDLATRRIPPGIPSLAITMSSAATVTVLAGLMSAVQGWQPLEARSLALVGAASLFLAGGYHFIVRSTREGDFSVIAPFRYTGLVLALLIGWLVWGDLPDALGWAGLALLMATGVYLIRAERRRATG
jgi:drug/metabolite transporter (DMT)-like permease